jgi:hypothetical protein
MLSNWMNVTDEGRSYDLEMKRMTDQSQYMVALFQQSSFILMVASQWQSQKISRVLTPNNHQSIRLKLCKTIQRAHQQSSRL